MRLSRKKEPILGNVDGRGRQGAPLLAFLGGGFDGTENGINERIDIGRPRRRLANGQGYAIPQGGAGSVSIEAQSISRSTSPIWTRLCCERMQASSFCLSFKSPRAIP
jgi:hypothetical protein